MKKVLILCDVPVDTMDRLRRYFDIERIYELYESGDLASWLQFHGYLAEYRQLSVLAHTSDPTLRKLLLALILGADYGKLHKLNERLLTGYLRLINEQKRNIGIGFDLADIASLHLETPKAPTREPAEHPRAFSPAGTVRTCFAAASSGSFRYICSGTCSYFGSAGSGTCAGTSADPMALGGYGLENI